MTRPLPSVIYDLANKPCAAGSRDQTGWTLIRYCQKFGVPQKECIRLVEQLHTNMAQPYGNTYDIQLLYEKVARVYAHPAGPRHSYKESGDDDPAQWHVINNAFPSLNYHPDNLGYALDFLMFGIAPIPLCWLDDNGQCAAHGPGCTSPGKIALIPWKEYQARLPSQADVERWWQQWPEANIGLITGSISKLVVLDFDNKQRFLEHPQMGFWLENTPVIETSRGFHVYIRSESEFPNRKMGGVDIKGEGGYIVAPPSIHQSGAEYTYCSSETARDSGSIISVYGGMGRYLAEMLGVEAPRNPRLDIIRTNVHEKLSDDFLTQLAEIDPDLQDRLEKIYLCGETFQLWKDDAGHAFWKVAHCGDEMCSCQSRGRARAFMNKAGALYDKMTDAYLVRIELGSIFNYVSTSHVKWMQLRQRMKALGIKGDLAEVPTGIAGEDGWPTIAAVGVVDGSIKDLMPDELIDEERVNYPAATMLQVIFSAYSGQRLYSHPDLWHAWFFDTKGKQKVRGIEDGKRIASKPKKSPHFCPQCGHELHRVHTFCNRYDLNQKIAQGKVKDIGNGYYQVVEKVEGRARASPVEQASLI